MNQDRKMFLQTHNDKFRAKVTKEKDDFQKSAMDFGKLQKEHANPGSYAPDMVSYSKAQLAKLLKEKKGD